MPKYKAGQIITFTYKNYRIICRVIRGGIYSCYHCDMQSGINSPCHKLMLQNRPFSCGRKLGLQLCLKIIRKYVMEEKERSNTNTKD